MLESESNGLPYINMKSFLKGGGFNKDGTKRFSGFYTSNDLLGDQDLVIANTDVTAGDIVGVPALLPPELQGEKVLYSHHVTRLRLNGTVTVPFLYYLLCLPEYRSWMLKFARGTTVLMLDMAAIRRIPVRVPKDKGLQHRITEILSTVDTAIEQTEALIAKYEQMKDGMMQDLFTCGLQGDGSLRPTRLEAPRLYIDSAIGWIPKEWQVVTLKSISSLCIDCPHSTPVLSHDGYLMARTSEIRDGRLLVDQSPKVSVKEYRYRVSRGVPKVEDIIFAREAPVGEAFVVPENMEICLGQRVMLIRTIHALCSPQFLLFQIYSARVQREFGRIVGGTTTPHLNVDEVRRFEIALPSREEREMIVARLAAITSFIEIEGDRLVKLRQQKYGLMRDLLMGGVSAGLANGAVNV
jgi:type I restriction enzyme S subunit